MKVILNTDVSNLGEEGDICTVAPGYARNFLLPKGLVLEYNERNLARIDERRAEIDARKEAKRAEAESMKQRIEAEPLSVAMTAGANGKLFGSVTAATIVEQLAARGIDVERKRIEVPDNSLKSLGNYKIRIRLYGDEEAILTVQVSASNPAEVAREQAKLAEQGAADEVATPPADEDASEAADSDEAPESTEELLDPEMIAMQQAADEAEGTADSQE